MGRVNFIVAALLMVSAISLVTSRYQARQLFIESDGVQSQARQLETGWRSLQLERAELARNTRVDAAARGELHMVPIVPDHTIYVDQAAPDTSGSGR
jgi:cell division protein FtsL